jgi:hypothetical protein
MAFYWFVVSLLISDNDSFIQWRREPVPIEGMALTPTEPVTA